MAHLKKNSDAILAICKQVAQQNNLRATINQSIKGAGIAGMSTMIGGLTMGPAGLVLGGTLGSVASYFILPKFQSLMEIIDLLTPEQKNQLASQVGKFFRGTPLDKIMHKIKSRYSKEESVVKIIDDVLTPEQKYLLVTEIDALFQAIQMDATCVMLVLEKNENLQQLILLKMTNYFKNELGMSFV